MKKETGFTLIELLIGIAVLAVLLGIGVPSFQEVMRANRTTTVTNDLVAALNFARSEAIRRGEAVEVCSSNDQTTCSGAWLDGWVVRSAAGPIRVWPVVRPGGAIGGGGTVTFNATGATGANIAFNVQFAGCAGTGARTVQVNPMGRISSAPIACF